MTKSERTRQEILAKAAPVFNSKGYSGATLSDLCEATGLTKGALYGNFESKEALSMAAFDFAVQKVKKLATEELKGKATCKAQLMALVTFYSRYVFKPPVEGGCPLLNTAIESDDHHVYLKGAVAAAIESTVVFIASLFDKGKKSGEFIDEVKSRELAFLFFCSLEGALMISRVSPTDEAMRLVVKQCKRIIDQISIH